MSIADVRDNYKSKSCVEEKQNISELHCLKAWREQKYISRFFVETIIQYFWFHKNVF